MTEINTRKRDIKSLIANKQTTIENELDSLIVKVKRLTKERDEARRELCAARRELCRNEAIIRLQRNRVHRDSEDVVGMAKEIAVERGWDCFNTPEGKLDKTLNGVIIDGGKAVPPKYEDIADG